MAWSADGCCREGSAGCGGALRASLLPLPSARSPILRGGNNGVKGCASSCDSAVWSDPRSGQAERGGHPPERPGVRGAALAPRRKRSARSGAVARLRPGACGVRWDKRRGCVLCARYNGARHKSRAARAQSEARRPAPEAPKRRGAVVGEGGGRRARRGTPRARSAGASSSVREVRARLSVGGPAEGAWLEREALTTERAWEGVSPEAGSEGGRATGGLCGEQRPGGTQRAEVGAGEAAVERRGLRPAVVGSIRSARDAPRFGKAVRSWRAAGVAWRSTGAAVVCGVRSSA